MDPREILARNVKRLMELNGLTSQGKAGEFAGVSQTMVGNILRLDQAPGIEFLEQLSSGFNISLWQILAPVEFLEMESQKIEKLVKDYLAASEEGRQTILRVAETESRYESK